MHSGHAKPSTSSGPTIVHLLAQQNLSLFSKCRLTFSNASRCMTVVTPPMLSTLSIRSDTPATRDLGCARERRTSIHVLRKCLEILAFEKKDFPHFLHGIIDLHVFLCLSKSPSIYFLHLKHNDFFENNRFAELVDGYRLQSLLTGSSDETAMLDRRTVLKKIFLFKISFFLINKNNNAYGSLEPVHR